MQNHTHRTKLFDKIMLAIKAAAAICVQKQFVQKKV